jgi:hypothetical protein
MYATLLFTVASLVIPRSEAPQQKPAVSPSVIDTASISGRVVDSTDSRPVVGAKVEVRAGGSNRSARIAVTDQDGRYTIPSLPSGGYSMRVEHSEYVTGMFERVSAAGGRFVVTVREGDAIKAIDFRLERAAIIRGRITDQTGNPTRASVSAHGGGNNVFVVGVATDEQGDYELRVPPGIFVIQALFIGARDRLNDTESYYPGVSQRDQAAALSVSAGDRLNGIDMALGASGVSISGRILSSGAGTAGITVAVVSSPAGVLRRSQTDRDGTMRFSELRPGRYIVFARARNGEHDDVAFEVVDTSQDIIDLTLSLAPAGRIRGRVVPPDGQLAMLDGVRVIAALMDGGKEVDPTSPDQVEVAPDGAFEIRGLFGERTLRLVGLREDWSTEVLTDNGRPVDRFTIPSGDVLDVQVVLKKD